MSESEQDLDGVDSPSEAASKAGKALSRLGASKGGRARSEALSPATRSQVAKVAAEARWGKKREAESKEVAEIPKATHIGELRIGQATLPCAVLEDGTRVFSQQGFLLALGRSRSARGGQGAASVDGPPSFMAAKNLKPFIPEELIASTKPVIFKPFRGPGYNGIAYGYRAELLPAVCRVYVAAQEAGVLNNMQVNVARQCELLLRGLQEVAIVSLVDEATGYQEVRVQNALAKILEAFISKELARWVKVFPDEFYEEMYRLKKWRVGETKSARTPAAGVITNDIVYDRLAPGVLDELKRLTPKDDKGRRKHHFHRILTEDIGNPKLREHLSSIVTLMRVSDNWPQFYRFVERAFPKLNDTPLLALGYDDE